jgi:hypothetical protein
LKFDGALPRKAEELLRDLRGLDDLLAETRREFDEERNRVAKALAESTAEHDRVARESERRVADAQARLEQTSQELARLRDEVERRRLEAEATVVALVRDKIRGFEFIARAWADYELALAETQGLALGLKEPPAPRAADVVREKGAAVSEARRRAKLAEWIVALYEFHFPWLTDLRDLDEEQGFVADAEPTSEDAAPEDPARQWLSKDEWRALPSAERNQLALERYLRSRQTPWQLGRDYERYIGYLREQAGYVVTYHGIIHGFDDLGRDVLAEKDGVLEVIQCKRWARRKEIHEKHIFQLFGTMVAARIEEPDKTIRGTFTTTTRLSERARKFAEVLEIRVEEDFPLADYPRVKCNIARTSGERIYHLPFDMQYDSTVIEPERAECYVMTCAEAEELGFRRALRWRGTVERAGASAGS